VTAVTLANRRGPHLKAQTVGEAVDRRAAQSAQERSRDGLMPRAPAQSAKVDTLLSSSYLRRFARRSAAVVSGVAAIFVLTALYRATNNAVQTTVPLLAQQAYGANSVMIGLLSGTIAAATVVAALLVNTQVRLHHAERLALVSFVALVIALPLIALARQFWALFPLVALVGIASGVLQPLLLTLTTAYSARASRNRNLGLFSVALSVSLLIGPLFEALVLQLSDASLPAVFLAFAAFVVCGALLAYQLMRSRNAQRAARVVAGTERRPTSPPPFGRGIRLLVRSRAYLLGVISNTAYVVPFTLLVAFGGPYLHTNRGLSYGAIQALFVVFYGASLAARSLLAYRPPTGGKFALVGLAFILTVLGLLVLGFTGDSVGIVVAFVLLGIPHGMTYPLSIMLIAESVPLESLGFANAVFGAIGGVVSVVVPLVAGAVILRVGYAVSFYLAALVTALACLALIALRVHARRAPLALAGSSTAHGASEADSRHSAHGAHGAHGDGDSRESLDRAEASGRQ